METKDKAKTKKRVYDLPLICKADTQAIMQECHNVGRWETVFQKILLIDSFMFLLKLHPILATVVLSCIYNLRQWCRDRQFKKLEDKRKKV